MEDRGANLGGVAKGAAGMARQQQPTEANREEIRLAALGVGACGGLFLILILFGNFLLHSPSWSQLFSSTALLDYDNRTRCAPSVYVLLSLPWALGLASET